MATYIELYNLMTLTTFGAQEFLNKIEIAAVIMANEILTGADTGAPYTQTGQAHNLRVRWATRASRDTMAAARELFRVIIGAYNAQSISAILAASDSQITAACRNAVDSLSENYPAPVT